MKLREPDARGPGDRAQPPRRHLRLGRGIFERDPGQALAQRPGQRGGDRGELPALGRHRRALQGARRPLRRPRLRRHRAQAPAQPSPGAGAGARRSAAVRMRGRGSCRVSRRRSDRRGRRHQQPDPRAATPPPSSRHRAAQQQVHLARHAQVIRGVHLHLRRDRARLDLGARLSLRWRTPRRSSSSAARRPGGRWASTR